MSDLERRSWLSRRHFCAGFAAAGCALITAPGHAALAALPARELSFYSLHTQESLSTVFWQDGRLVPDALAEIDWHPARLPHRRGARASTRTCSICCTAWAGRCNTTGRSM